MFKPMSGEQLQAARRAAAARFAAVAAKYLPKGYTVAYRKSLSGHCSIGRKHIVAPRPVTRRSLYVFLHECAHAHLNHVGKAPRHVEEMQAEQWAQRTMRAEGIAVPRKESKEAKRYVFRKLNQAIRRGAKTLNLEAMRFAGMSKTRARKLHRAVRAKD
jgi:hypothetical protein